MRLGSIKTGQLKACAPSSLLVPQIWCVWVWLWVCVCTLTKIQKRCCCTLIHTIKKTWQSKAYQCRPINPNSTLPKPLPVGSSVTAKEELYHFLFGKSYHLRLCFHHILCTSHHTGIPDGVWVDGHASKLYDSFHLRSQESLIESQGILGESHFVVWLCPCGGQGGGFVSLGNSLISLPSLRSHKASLPPLKM